MRFNRKGQRVLFMAFGIWSLSVVVHAGATQKLTASLIGPLETAQGQGLVRFADRLKALTGGTLEVTIYPDGQLGALAESLEQVQQGMIDLTVTPPGVMAEFLPQIQVYAVPFVFRGFEHWKAVVGGDIGEEISNLAAAKADVIILGYFGGSVRQLVTRKKVASVEDMKNLRIRLHPSEVQITAWRAVKAAPTVLGYREIYNALQLGVIDALENEPEWIVRMKFYEQAPFIALTSHEVVTRPLVFSKVRFEALSREHQQAVLQAGREASTYERELEHRLDLEKLIELKEKHGAELIKIDSAVFRAKAQEALALVLRKQGLGELVRRIQEIE